MKGLKWLYEWERKSQFRTARAYMGEWYRAGFPAQGPLPLVSAQNDVTCLLRWLPTLSDLWCWKLPLLYIFLTPTHFLLVPTPHIQFMWHFCCPLFTFLQLHILFMKSTLTSYQRSICKKKYFPWIIGPNNDIISVENESSYYKSIMMCASLCNHPTMMMIFTLSCILFHIGYIELTNKGTLCTVAILLTLVPLIWFTYLKLRFILLLNINTGSLYLIYLSQIEINSVVEY